MRNCAPIDLAACELLGAGDRRLRERGTRHHDHSECAGVRYRGPVLVTPTLECDCTLRPDNRLDATGDDRGTELGHGVANFSLALRYRLALTESCVAHHGDHSSSSATLVVVAGIDLISGVGSKSTARPSATGAAT